GAVYFDGYALHKLCTPHKSPQTRSQNLASEIAISRRCSGSIPSDKTKKELKPHDDTRRLANIPIVSVGRPEIE
ncbi:MAG: hypothetical protein PHN90_09670, partial [Methanothrix sp.]|nr:hypothetical protein [Methanothrix sp.]